MTLDPIDPRDLATGETYSHVVVATGSRLVGPATWRAARCGDHKPADALIGVATPAHPGCLIEVEAIAVTG
jgi:hypothetical protein